MNRRWYTGASPGGSHQSSGGTMPHDRSDTERYGSRGKTSSVCLESFNSQSRTLRRPYPPRVVRLLAANEPFVSQQTQTATSVTDRHLCVLGNQSSGRPVESRTQRSQDEPVRLRTVRKGITTRNQHRHPTRRLPL